MQAQAAPYFDRDIAKFTPRQMEAVKASDSGAKFIMFGGALGGGKSYLLRWNAVRRLMYLYQRYKIANLQAMLACEDYPALKDRQLSKIEQEFPSWLGRFYSDHRAYGRSYILHKRWGGGIICFRNLDDPSKYQSAEFVLIEVDELTKNLYDVFTLLRSRLRWPGIPDDELQFIGATNPGGVGHSWCKQLWIDRDFPEEWTKPIDFRDKFVFIPSKADDNPHLDEAYWAMLQTLPPNLRKAFRDGDWDIFLGQAFPDFSRQIHVIPSWPVPENAPLYMTFDWGFGKPFSIGWWYVDNDGRVVRFAEWYGWNGTADEGLRIPDSEIAEGIIKREETLGIKDRPIIRLAGHDCWNKKPDYRGGGQGKSTAEVFTEYKLFLTKADADRKLKIRQFRERLRVPRDEEGNATDLPMLLVHDCCAQFIRTLPNLVMDERNVEDVDTSGEDHIYDEACQICMARPIKPMKAGKPAKNDYAKRIDQLESGVMSDGDRFEREMIQSFGRDPGPWARAEMGEVVDDSSPY